MEWILNKGGEYQTFKQKLKKNFPFKTYIYIVDARICMHRKQTTMHRNFFLQVQHTTHKHIYLSIDNTNAVRRQLNEPEL